MLNVLVNVVFGAGIPHDELRSRYLPAIENVIAYILVDTVVNQLGVPTFRVPALTRGHALLKRDRQTFEELVDRVIRMRVEGAGFWPLLTAAGTEVAVRSNVRVFLAGALEATASYISWTLSNLARDPVAQERVFQESRAFPEITPEAREGAVYLQQVLAESLRLNNALYFLPRVALRDTTVSTARGTLTIPADTHIVLATYHANRCEEHWGVAATGYPATTFAPDRWDAKNMESRGRSSKDNLHFGFGHGPRVCIGKHFSEAEAFVCVTLFVRRFRFRAVHATTDADSGVSTRPRDRVDVELSLRS
jgi:cytochrome P450